MAVSIKFFASLRDYTGIADSQIEYQGLYTVEQVWSAVMPDKAMPANTLAAINMEYVDLAAKVRDGDEVAFFPPVTGG